MWQALPADWIHIEEEREGRGPNPRHGGGGDGVPELVAGRREKVVGRR